MKELQKFGYNLKFYRKQKGYTQTDLAAFVSCGRSNISKIEAGEIDVPLSLVQELANALDVSPVLLMDCSAPDQDETEERLMDYFKKLNVSSKEELCKRAKELMLLEQMESGNDN